VDALASIVGKHVFPPAVDDRTFEHFLRIASNAVESDDEQLEVYRSDIESRTALSSELFQRCIDRMLDEDLGYQALGELDRFVLRVAEVRMLLGRKHVLARVDDRLGAPIVEVPIDFAILTALEVERTAFCAALGMTDRDRQKKDARVYWRGRIPLEDDEVYEI